MGVDLLWVISPHDPGELGNRIFNEKIAELSIDVGLHVA